MPARVSAMIVVALAGIGLSAGLPPLVGCGRALEPASRPIDKCRQGCKTQASRQCSEAECERGCEFILDRIVEKESDNVLACVARNPRRCTDVVWAHCAAQIGVHADGGPPAPPPPKEDD